MKVWALHSTPPSHHCPDSNLVQNIFESSQQPNPSWSTNLKPPYQNMSPAFDLLWCPWRLDGIGVFKQARLILWGLPRDEAIKVAETQTSVLRKRMDGLRYIIPPGYLTHVVASFFGPLETNGGRVFPKWVDFQKGEVGTLQNKRPELSSFNSEISYSFVSQPLRKFPADALVAN